jgi:hypothetical protein
MAEPRHPKPRKEETREDQEKRIRVIYTEVNACVAPRANIVHVQCVIWALSPRFSLSNLQKREEQMRSVYDPIRDALSTQAQKLEEALHIMESLCRPGARSEFARNLALPVIRHERAALALLRAHERRVAQRRSRPWKLKGITGMCQVRPADAIHALRTVVRIKPIDLALLRLAIDGMVRGPDDIAPLIPLRRAFKRTDLERERQNMTVEVAEQRGREASQRARAGTKNGAQSIPTLSREQVCRLFVNNRI